MKARRTPRRPGLDDKRYRAMREQLKARREGCWICGYAIDQQLNYPHPMSWSCDHVIPRSQLSADDPRNWHISNGRSAHLRCNQSRGAKPAPYIPLEPIPDTSIDW